MGPIFQRVWFLVRPNCLVMKVGALTYSRFSFKFPRLIHTFEQCFSRTLMYVLDHCAPIHLQQVMYNLGHWQRLANKKLSWEDKHHTINGSTLLHLAIHGHGRSTVPDSTTADIQKAITCPGQLEISPIKAATHGLNLITLGSCHSICGQRKVCLDEARLFNIISQKHFYAYAARVTSQLIGLEDDAKSVRPKPLEISNWNGGTLMNGTHVPVDLLSEY